MMMMMVMMMAAEWLERWRRESTRRDAHRLSRSSLRCSLQTTSIHLQFMMILRYIRHKHPPASPSVHHLGRGASPCQLSRKKNPHLSARILCRLSNPSLCCNSLSTFPVPTALADSSLAGLAQALCSLAPSTTLTFPDPVGRGFP